MATSAAISAWLAASRDKNEDVIQSAVWGVSAAASAGRASPEFTAGVFDRLVELLDHSGSLTDIVEGATGALIRLDPGRTLPILLHPGRCTASNSRLHDIVKAIEGNGLQIPPARVFQLVSELRPQVDDYLASSTICCLLRQLGHQRVPEVEALAADIVSGSTPGSPGAKRLQLARAEVTAIVSGVENATSCVLTRLETVREVSRLTGPQRAYYVAWVLHTEVSNGGFAQYFVNSSGGSARDAAAAFEQIEATAQADIVRKAVAVFGRNGPALERESRHDQLAGLSASQDALLEQLDAEYYRVGDEVPLKLAYFASKHPSDFTPDALESRPPATD